MLISPEQEAVIGRVFESYLTEHHQGDILQLIVDTDEETHQPVVVNAMTLFEANMEVGDYFNAFPNDVLAIFDKVLERAAVELSEKASLSHCRRERAKGQRMRRILHARITGLPVCPELTRDTIPRSRDVGHFLSVTGTVIRTSVAKVLEYERDYMCIKCRHVFMVQADFDQFYTFVPPVTCPNPDGCNSYKFTCLSGGSEPAACRDYQEIKIQEQVQRLSVGSIPRSMVVVLEDDLVDSCKSGDDVTVYGVMCQRWKPFYDDARCEVELVLKANNIEVNNQQAAAALLMKDVQQEFEAFWENYIHDPLAGRNQILLSLCPQVFGMYVVKLAVAMVLAGGVQRIDSSGTKIRGECHMLLVGDPGTGKSQFLKYAAKIMPRSVLTAGIGSTSAGLTVAAVKDGGEWHLEAGALVLSDGGLCCIDEFNSIKEHDRISIHEAMEQQSISVAKAGIVCKLNTRSTILAATNPKGQYNPDEPLSVNVALASPLLSRFDLVLVLLDTRNAEWDRIISSFILEDRGMPADSSGLWSMEKMKAYFSLIRRLQPQLSEEANSILTRYYQLQRQSNGRNAARTTIRMLESLSRLAEAHARLMYREMVTVEDAVMAVSVMECSMQGGALLGNVNALLTSFPANPGQQYLTQCQALLEGLNLPQLLGREMDRLARLRDCTSEPPQFDPPTENYQHDLRDTNTIDDKHHQHQVSSDCKGNLTVEAGLDWFHSIALSVSPDDTSPPIITSTQGNLSREPSSAWSTASKANKQPYRQTGKDNQSNTISASDRDGAFTSGQRSVTQEEEKQPERQKDEQHPTSVGCVVQKVSKNLRGRRLRKLELNNQQYDREGGGHQTSESLSISRLSSDTNRRSENLVQENQASGRQRRVKEEDQRDQTGAKSICTVLRKKMEAEAQTGEELQAKLSDFIFKPRKMRLSLHSLDFNAGGDVGVELQTELDPGSRDLHLHTENRVCQQMLVSHRTDAESNDAGKGSRRKQVSCSSELADGESEDRTGSTSKHRDEDIFSLRGGTVGRIKGSNNAENVCGRQSTKVNTAGWTTADGSPPLNSSTYVSDLAPVQSDHIKSTVASSSRAKLSRFSFTCTTKPTTVAQTVVDTSPPAALGQNGTQSLGAKSEFDTTIDSPVRSPSGTKMETVKCALRPPATALTPGQGQEQGAESKTMCKAKQTDPNRAAKRLLSNGPVGYDGAVSRIKRKCFELGPPPSGVGGSKGLFSGLSLFESVELSNDVLDTDWDREVSKKVKV